MKKVTLLVRTLLLILSLCMVVTSAACGGNDKNNSGNKENSSQNILIGDAVDDEDEDITASDSTGLGIVSTDSSAGGGNNIGGGGTVNAVSSGTEKVDVNARQAFFDSVPKKFDGKTVKVMVWWEWHDWEKDKFADLEKETGIKVESIVAGAPDGGNYYSKLNASIMQKSAPDLACLSSSYLPTVITQNYFQPLSVAKLDLTDSAYDIKTMDYYKYKNKYYGAIVKGTTVPVTLSVMYYNEDMFRKHNITSPGELYRKGMWNWDTMLDSALKLREKTGKQAIEDVDDLRNIYGALVLKRPVCVGYATAYSYLLQKVGIQSVIARGECHGGGRHAWNIVKLGGKYYSLGDMAWRDKDGYYWFEGRADDVIKSSGYRIGPFEVESALMTHPAVVECAITGIPDETRGMVVKATVVLGTEWKEKAGDVLVEELQAHVKRVTAPYKYPRIIEFVDELPKTISGKIRRVEIREKDKK